MIPAGAAPQGRRRRRRQRAACARASRCHRADAAFKAGNVERRTPATTSSAATSRTARWPRCTSRSRTTRRRIRALRRHRLDVPVHAQHQASLPVNDKAVLDQPMTLVAGRRQGAGGVEGTGAALVVEHTADNNLVTFRFKNAGREDARPPRRTSSWPAGSSAPARSSFRTPIARSSSRC